MAIATNDGFSIGAKVPVDSRFFFDTVADMAAYPENLIPSTYFCACDGDFYVFNKANEDDITTGKWRKLKGNDSSFSNNVPQFKNYSELITLMAQYSTIATIPNGMTVALQESEEVTDSDGSIIQYSYGLYRYNSSNDTWNRQDYLVREELEKMKEENK